MRWRAEHPEDPSHPTRVPYPDGMDVDLHFFVTLFLLVYSVVVSLMLPRSRRREQR